jgi:hypothetical protein
MLDKLMKTSTSRQTLLCCSLLLITSHQGQTSRCDVKLVKSDELAQLLLYIRAVTECTDNLKV